MGNKDKGWDYLNSDDVNSTFNSDEDGSWGYRNDDGSGSFYGEDGSWGYQNADGSGSYHGADGSWGYKNSDGSGSYHGADGSWGYKNTDGSGSFHGSDDETVYYDADIDEEDGSFGDSSSSTVDLFAGLAGIALGLGAAAYSKRKQKELEEELNAEERRREQERIRQIKKARRKKESKVRNKRIKALLFNKKKIMIGVSTSSLVGDSVDEVVSLLKETGFNNIQSIPVKDLYVDSVKRVNEVEQVVINGQSWFEEDDMIPYDAEIIITYHMKREIRMPASSRNMRKGNYKNVVQDLFALGFTEIYTKEIDDLVTGWITKDGTVKKITVNNQEEYKKGSVFDYDVEIVVSYHTFKKKRK